MITPPTRRRIATVQAQCQAQCQAPPSPPALFGGGSASATTATTSGVVRSRRRKVTRSTTRHGPYSSYSPGSALITAAALMGALILLMTPIMLLIWSLQTTSASEQRRIRRAISATNESVAYYENTLRQRQHHLPEHIAIDPNDATKYYTVFSTDCTAYHSWQSYVFFYWAWKVGQPGTIVRIASGCNAKQEKEAEDYHFHHIEQAMSGRFKVHFTPDYSFLNSKGGNDNPRFPFYNKPFGVRHWMEHALGFPTREDDDDAIIILMDPDMIFVRPITRHFHASKDVWYQNQTFDFTVDHGKPVAQQYILIEDWTKWNLTDLLDSSATGLSAADGETEPVPQNEVNNSGSPALRWVKKKGDSEGIMDDDRHGSSSREELLAKHFQVGPPYIVTARDMYHLTKRWCELVESVYQTHYRDMLAEMLALVVAAADLNLFFTQSNSLMYSDPRVEYTEPWIWVEELEPRENICSKELLSHYEATTKLTNSSMTSQSSLAAFQSANVLHYCQPYSTFLQFEFLKYPLRGRIHKCHHPLLEETIDSPETLRRVSTGHWDYHHAVLDEARAITKQDAWAVRINQRETFMTCQLTFRVNEAMEHHRLNACHKEQQLLARQQHRHASGGENAIPAPGNTERSYRLHAANQ